MGLAVAINQKERLGDRQDGSRTMQVARKDQVRKKMGRIDRNAPKLYKTI